jgi:hypothetical protein
MVSSPIQTPQSVISSTNVSMVNLSKTDVLLDFTLMNIQEHVYGQQQQTEKDARKTRRNSRMASSAHQKRTRMMPMDKSLPIHTSHTQKTVRSSTYVLMELNHVN